MTVLYSETGSGKYVMEAVIAICGPDISVCICGGTHYHIGASALGIPRESLRDKAKPSASVSVLTAVGHKEDELSKHAAHHLATEFGCRVSVSAGVHIDNATPDDIQLLWANYEKLLGDIISQIRSARQ